MLDAELAEVVANLRVLGADITDVEVKSSKGGLPKSLRAVAVKSSETSGCLRVLW
jgi:ATP-dependent DNA helicase RecG